MQMWEERRPVVEPMEEDEDEADEKEDIGEGSSIGNLVPEQALALQATMPAAPKFWAAGPSDQVAQERGGHQLEGLG